MAIKNKIVAARISEVEKLQLDMAARDLDISNSRLLRELIRVFLNNNEEFKNTYFQNIKGEE